MTAATPGLDQDALDAQRYRKLQAMLQRAYDGETVDHDGLQVYCTMRTGFKEFRTVVGEIVWTDKRDEPLDLNSVLDRL